MVCPYCQSKTTVYNSRHNKTSNKTWRRRQCTKCGASFSTEEQIQHDKTVTYHSEQGILQPFSRIKLFVSIYEACKHLKQPDTTAEALTETIIKKLNLAQATINRAQLVACAQETLQAYDNAAAVTYSAYHPI